MIDSIFNGNVPCETPLFVPISPNSTVGDVITPCFALVFLPFISAVLSGTCLCFLLFYGSVVISPSLLVSKTLVTKLCLSSIIIVASFIRFIIALIHVEGDSNEVVYGSGLLFASSVTAFLSYVRCWRRGIPSSAWLSLDYLFRLFLVFPEAIVINNYFQSDFASYTLFGIEAIALLFLNILLCFADKFDHHYENFNNGKVVDPYRTSSSLSRSFFDHASSLISKGYHGTLNFDSFWSLDSRNDPERLLLMYRKYRAHVKDTRKKLIPWLFVVLLKVTWFPVAAGSSLTVVLALISILDPVFLKLIITSTEENLPLWCGLTLVAGSLISSLLRFIMMARSDFYGQLGYIDIQSVLVNVVYEKMLKLSPSSKLKYSAGEVVNLLSVDVDRIRYFWFSLLDFIYWPLTVVICFVGLALTVGINILYGAAVILLFVPINAVLIKFAAGFEQRQMDLKDERLKLMADVLSGVKVLKLYAWEESMRKRIAAIRKLEVAQRKYAVYCYAGMEAAYSACPILAVIVTFVGYIVIQGNPLTPQVAFLSIMLFNLMRYAIFRIPHLIHEVVNARISLNRIQDFLLEPEIPEVKNSLIPRAENVVVELQNASFSWDPTIEASTLPTLKAVTLEIREGELIGIIGSVGSGKSSLLASICGELNLTTGLFYRRQPLSVAYVFQQAWIQNLSLRDNILFGTPFDPVMYQQTISACALEDDLKMLSAGDATEIGERGINLSGGQKARVALARAVYRGADLYILDDTLSAVDSHVGSHIFDNVIGSEGLLKDKTRIFALNSVSFLPRCDRIAVMKEGRLIDIGTFDELNKRRSDTFMKLVRDLEKKTDNEEDTEKALMESTQIRQRKIISGIEETDASHAHSSEAASKLIEDEELVDGKVSFKMYVDYVKAFGLFLILAYIVVLYIFRTVFESFSQVWLAKWSSSYGNTTSYSTLESLEIYGAASIGGSIVSGIAVGITAFGSYRASKKLHNDLLFSLLRSPMSFFDTTPLGRILNRLSKDIDKIDNDVPSEFYTVTFVVGECIFYTASALIVMPQVALLSVPLMIVFVAIVRYYTFTSVQIRRLCSIAWSAVASHTQDSYIGVSTLRVFGVQDRFKSQMLQKSVLVGESNLAEITTNQWIQMRMDTLTIVFSSVLTALSIYFGHIGYLSTGGVALVTSTGTMLRGLMGDIARTFKDMEMAIVAVERVQEYVDNEPEAEWITPTPPPASWPSEGHICFKDFSLRYRPTTPLVLKSLNVEIAAGEKVGIVGRTGAGKTSLTMALFRMIEPASGTIYIDGVDFKSLGLHDLRRALTIIPQDPVLFCGTLRVNLDPFDDFDDSTLWDAIEKAHLKSFVDTLPLKLNHEISEGGGNLSVGQRQLICLARAVLRQKTKILVLDEATASVDLETDQKIQASIRSQFGSCTILTIAHRLNTIIDYDKVLVMDGGEIQEFDSPTKLLENKQGLFYSLAAQAKLV